MRWVIAAIGGSPYDTQAGVVCGQPVSELQETRVIDGIALGGRRRESWCRPG